MMALELLGGRILSPTYGSSIHVWAAVISVFILSLSIGYWLGGRLADRAQSNRVLAWVIIIAAAFYLILPTYMTPMREAFGSFAPGNGGMLLLAIVLFLPPSLLLGCVSPLLVRLVFVDAERVGRTTGTLYAIGSCGNVLGILVADYVLIKYFDIWQNMLGMGVVLSITGLAHLFVPVRVIGVPVAAHEEEANQPSVVAVEA
jgi:MFS family permease